jgi:hypothetical protein
MPEVKPGESRKDKITILEILNRIIQILFIRICRETNGKVNKTLRFGILIGIIPFTGWKTNYKYVFDKPKLIWFTKGGKRA